MQDPRHIQIKDYNYDLPDERIAKFPLAERDSSKLLIYNKGKVSEDVFTSLPKYLPQHSLMVFNNTRVIQARLHFRKDTGSMIEIFCLEPSSPIDYQQNFASKEGCTWICLIGNLKRWKQGVLSRKVTVCGKEVTFTAEKGEEHHGGSHYVSFTWDDDDVSFAEILDAVGELPIPPYLNRKTEESDKRTYQTVYSKIKGSVAAPTAGLHFTERVLKAIDEAGITREELTLHVGAGTFKPVKSDEIEGHEMHSEYIVVKRQTIQRLLEHDGRAIAVGTTSVRTLESLYYIGVKLQGNPDLSEDELHIDQWMPYDYAKGEEIPVMQALGNIDAYMEKNELDALHTSTQIIIAPGYDYKIVRMMVTNFHQPQSTLLLLVSAFVNGDWHKIYNYALDHDFRFLSYGDSSLLIP